MAEWMCGERLARKKDVTRLVRSSGGGGGSILDMVAAACLDSEAKGWQAKIKEERKSSDSV